MRGNNTTPIDEQEIAYLVELADNLESIANKRQKLSAEEKNEVITALHSALCVKINRGHIIREREHKPWYMAAKARNDSKFWNRYRQYLLKIKHWNGETFNELDKATDEIMDMLGNPEEEYGFLRRGLCIGDVQSGKTSCYIGLINKAADAHYKVIILLTGTIEKLRRQTQQRIDEGFIGLDSNVFTLKRDQIRVGVGTLSEKGTPWEDVSAWAMTSTTSDFNTSTARRLVGQLSNINSPVIFVVKKNKSVLEKLEKWLSVYNLNKNINKIDLPMILIDDEADNASVNTKIDDITTINKCIRNLLNLFVRSNYIGFTATPYANIFIDPDSETEMQNQDLFPKDFIYALESPSNYIGARSIFSEDGIYRYMLESNDDCEDALPIKHKIDAKFKFIPESLKEAIATFFVANAVRDLRGDSESHRTMMINISRFIAVQKNITKKIDGFVRDWKCQIENYCLTGNQALQYESFKYAKNAFEKYFQSLDKSKFSDLKYFTWQEIQSVLYQSIASIEVRTINGGNAAKNLNYEDYECNNNSSGLRLIAIGGISLSRGLTLEGLCVSYFYRNSSMYDTLMQMGRWFGYRQNYQDLCKIWMPEDSMSWYEHISEATDELRDEVKRMQNQNMTPADFGLEVRSNIYGLLVTARNKMRTAHDYERIMNFSGEVIETRYVHSTREILRKNYDLTINFILDLEKNYKVYINEPKLAVKHPQFLSVTKKYIESYLKNFCVHSMNISTGFDTFKLIEMFNGDSKDIFNEWDILIAGGTKNNNSLINFANLEIHPVTRSFAFREDVKSLQMSGKNSRLGSKDLAKGGLTPEIVKKIESDYDSNGKSFSETFYFKSGYKRNPLLVIYPVRLIGSKIDDKSIQSIEKQNIINQINFPVVGLSIGIPLIDGIERVRVNYKINKQRWLEIFGADNEDDFDENDEIM